MSTRSIVVVTAGLSQPSSTRLLSDRLAEAAEAELDGAGQHAVVTTIELRDLAHAITDNLLLGFPGTQLRAAIDAVVSADAVIAVTPIFSSSYSGLFKSFFDILETGSLAGKPVVLGATGGSARHSLALEYAIRPLFAYLKAAVVPTAVFAASEDWGGADTAGAEELRVRIDRAAAELAAALAPAHGGSVTAAPSPSSASVSAQASAQAAAPLEVVPFAQQLARLAG